MSTLVDNNSKSPHENGDRRENTRQDRPRDRLPPEHSLGIKMVLWGADAALIVSSGVFLALCAFYFLWPESLPSCLCWPYLALSVLLVSLFTDRFLRYRAAVHNARLEDRSEVMHLIRQAFLVEPRLRDPVKPDNFVERRDHVSQEATRLQKLRPMRWTEYNVLPLRRLLVDFLRVEDLKARAQSSLADLEEYAEDSAYRYDMRLYLDWKGRVNEARDKIDQPGSSPDRQDENAEQLRAELRMLLAHVAEYQANWADGSVIIRSLLISGAVAVPVLVILGFLPVIYTWVDRCSPQCGLTFLNWAFIGASGAITSGLLSLYRSNRVEVGNTQGRAELFRTVAGTTLGFVAGVLMYCIVSGGLVEKGLVIPDTESASLKDLSLSFLLAFAAGYSFERIFDRVLGLASESK